MKIVIGTTHRGLSWSDRAWQRLRELGYTGDFEDRTHPLLVQVAEELGPSAGSRFDGIMVVDVPEDVEWTLEECEGVEWIAEKHRTWP